MSTCIIGDAQQMYLYPCHNRIVSSLAELTDQVLYIGGMSNPSQSLVGSYPCHNQIVSSLAELTDQVPYIGGISNPSHSLVGRNQV